MPLFVISWTDRADGGADIRAAARPDHLAYVAANPGVVKLGGPFLDDDETMVGSLMIIEAADLEAAADFHANDPYRLAGLFERSQIRPWRVTIGSLG
ncbi:uncharacterized protein YciI [Caulobacter ginsengisoli]|uniref:Uncharacterized protein YciI n=1 Tax=Caulobacter ginsengisoli TaxID=400775 RepID=A0ABU0IU04_9CAUL|nr:YciI family protein [Caulobacter ginsengisoli]MDQ0465487.1 uncharacterized protein YciI [Caulobacter ginsengisoli]